MTRSCKRRTADSIPFSTVRQLAERWQCSEKSVRRLIDRGELVAHRIAGQLRVSHADRLTFEKLRRMQ
jgi:excisionase family DNA binding protein